MTSMLEALKELFTDNNVKPEHSVDSVTNQGREIWLGKADIKKDYRYVSIWIDKVFLDLSVAGPVTFVPAVFGAASCIKAGGDKFSGRNFAETNLPTVNPGGLIMGKIPVSLLLPTDGNRLEMSVGLKLVENQNLFNNVIGLIGTIADAAGGVVTEAANKVLDDISKKASSVVISLLTFGQEPIRLLGKSAIDLSSIGKYMIWVAEPRDGGITPNNLEFSYENGELKYNLTGNPAKQIYTRSAYMVFEFIPVDVFPDIGENLPEVKESVVKMLKLIRENLTNPQEISKAFIQCELIILEDVNSMKRFDSDDLKTISGILRDKLSDMRKIFLDNIIAEGVGDSGEAAQINDNSSGLLPMGRVNYLDTLSNSNSSGSNKNQTVLYDSSSIVELQLDKFIKELEEFERSAVTNKETALIKDARYPFKIKTLSEGRYNITGEGEYHFEELDGGIQNFVLKDGQTVNINTDGGVLYASQPVNPKIVKV